MRTFFVRNWLVLLLIMLAIGVAVLIRVTGDAPLLLGPFVRLDGLGLFFLFAAIAGMLVDTLINPPRQRPMLRLLALSAFTLTTRVTPLIALGYVALALVAMPIGRLPPAPERSNIAALGRWFGSLVRAAPLPLAAICVAVGYGTLALRGAWKYDDQLAGAALDSLVFWFVLLGATLPVLTSRTQHSTSGVLFMVWFYPLVRLYSFGPWNSGWGLATVLFGGAVALWLATHAFRASACADAGRTSVMALALACFGLGTSAGIAAGCYAALVGASLDAPPAAQPTASSEERRLVDWLSGPVIPFAAPFVAIWLVIGAAIAGGSIALAGVAWLAALLGGLALALVVHQPSRRVRLVRNSASLVLGIGAPLLIGQLIAPAVAQLQGGLTAYGDLLVWPWVGVAVVNSAQTQVAVLPSLAIAVLMLVLISLIYLVKQLLAPAANEDGNVASISAESLLDALRQEVPWLGGHRGQERPVDPE